MGVSVVFNGLSPRNGTVTFSLESPDMQLQELGNVSSSESFFSVAVFISEGAPVQGVWKLILEASEGAEGWTAILFELTIDVKQCI